MFGGDAGRPDATSALNRIELGFRELVGVFHIIVILPGDSEPGADQQHRCEHELAENECHASTSHSSRRTRSPRAKRLKLTDAG